MKKLVLLGLLAGLSACATSPTLQEKLADKGPEERRAILREECLAQSSRKVVHGRNLPKGHMQRRTELCDAMHSEMQGRK